MRRSIKSWLLAGAALVLLLVVVATWPRGLVRDRPLPKSSIAHGIALPAPRQTSAVSIEEALLKRQSVRDYRPLPLTLTEVAQLLWAAQGISARPDYRTVPSAGALYPLEVYLVVGQVSDLRPSVYHYEPEAHALTVVVEGDQRSALSAAALHQTWVRDGAVSLVFTAVYERTTGRYGDRGTTYVHMEAGHASQNVYLQAVALGLGTVAVGAFEDDQVKRVLGLPAAEQPLYIMPVGRR
jgi:SagB-type dehydrogenase family enzyme